MSFTKSITGAVILLAMSSLPVIAQDRPFLFSVSTTRSDSRRATVHYEMGMGEREFDLADGDQPEQRFGIQTSIGRGFTMLARVGVALEKRDARASQQAEVLYSVLQAPGRGASLAVGGGMRHESAGTNVLVGRVTAGRAFTAWRLDSNVIFEKPFSAGRDVVDLITTVGIARRITPAVHLGVELVGEDLEGFWEADEAEGGARVLAGPSLPIAPAGRRWQLSVAGGPMMHATRARRLRTAHCDRLVHPAAMGLPRRCRRCTGSSPPGLKTRPTKSRLVIARLWAAGFRLRASGLRGVKVAVPISQVRFQVRLKSEASSPKPTFACAAPLESATGSRALPTRSFRSRGCLPMPTQSLPPT
jgi:hypothetical protein